MLTVNFLAQLLGFSMVIISLSLLIRPKNIQNILQLMDSETALFIHGIIRVIVGIAVLLSYNAWNASWKIVITILGWLILISGIGLLFMPSLAEKMVVKLKTSEWTSFIFIAVLILGCALVYFGITA